MSLRQQNKLKARASILNAAETLIANKGIEAATTRDIAKLAGLSYQTLYNYFPTKADIVHAILESEMALWSTAADNITKHYSGDLITALVGFIEISLDAINRTGRDLWGFVATQAFNRELSSSDVSSAFSVAHEHYYALLNLAQGMGHLRPDTDLHLLAHALFNLHDYAMLQYFLEIRDDSQFVTTQRQIVELVVGPYLRTE
ncbi:MAG: TetR family transcriptional regulator [Pseudomonadales bacterium]|nr:TetR family transcriptional regulator [Pseudomonadales bacterium]